LNKSLTVIFNALAIFLSVSTVGFGGLREIRLEPNYTRITPLATIEV